MGIRGLWERVALSAENRTLKELAVSELKTEDVEGDCKLRLFKIGIDASLWMHRAGKSPELRTLFFRLRTLLKLPLHAVFVFDGLECLPDKGHKARSSPHWLTCDFQHMLELFGFHWTEAPSEAEAELAAMNVHGVIDAVMTEDSDREWYQGANRRFASKYHQRATIALEFINQYKSNEARFLTAYPEAELGHTQLLKAINKARTARGERVSRSKLFQLSNHPTNSPIILPQSFLISFSHNSQFSASSPPPQRTDRCFSHAFFERISRKLRVWWSYRVFGVFEKLRGDKGFLGAQRPVSFSSFGHLPSFSGSVHCPNPLLDRTSPCCPAPYPFLLLPLAPPHFVALSPAHFASEPPRPYNRFEALIHGFHSRPSAPRSAAPFAHHSRFSPFLYFIALLHHFIYIFSPLHRAPINPILILTAFAAAVHPFDPLPDTSARSSAIHHSRVSLPFPPFPLFLTQFLTKPSRPYTHFEALVRLFRSVYSPLVIHATIIAFYITLSSLLLQYSKQSLEIIVLLHCLTLTHWRSLPGIHVKETKGV
ncbi:uncharacterized protein F5147DRAFT_840840 [Suillus discolor]|uniref:XPG-I domain-containing protein n=1 Tax=Suillus discolor TaxID=1912936 RepID=A0A9P7JND1_9AGAM|nr:uncharacterized protein F5147DRAFT_840840 [Suillus discolor]KAG2091356.1 hypothetical protein F5147DRAFT_840840 [Suillus discolor]